jgi:replicative DNA helicase
MQVLGCLLQQPSLLSSTNDFNINNDDFPEAFHKIIFASINNLYQSGVKVIDEPTIDGFLMKYDTQYQIFSENDGVNYLTHIKSISQLDNFKYHYKRIKKFSFLRSCKNKGIDFSDIYDTNIISPTEDEKMKRQFDELTLEDMTNRIKSRVIELQDEFSTAETSQGIQAAKGMKELKEELKKNPDYGAPLCSNILNTVLRGARLGKFYLRSLPSGGGKTRLAIADLLNICCDELYDVKKKRWTSNGEPGDGLFITTELDDDEIQTIMMAFISGVDEEKILTGKLSKEEDERVDHAIDIIARSGIHIKYIDDFSIEDIKQIIEKYVIDFKVKYVVFDYIHTSIKLMSEVSKKSQMNGLREDQLLLLLSTELKGLAKKYDIWLMSSTQTNDNYKEQDGKDAGAVSGAHSIPNKVDAGMIMSPVTNKDKKLVESILHNGFTNDPNYMCSVYKNRRSTYNKMIIWQYIDLGTMRTKDCFVTKMDGTLVKVPPTELRKVKFDF